MNILLAGGAGYIGSHTAVSLLDAGHDVIIADNFMNSSPVAVDRIREREQSRYLVDEDFED